MPTPPRIRVTASSTGMLFADNALPGSHTGPEFDKLIPLIEEVAVPGLGIPSVPDRIQRFVGACAS